MYPTFDSPPPRKRPRWIWPVVAVVAVVLLLCCGVFGLTGALGGSEDNATGEIVPAESSGETQTASPTQRADGKIRDEGWRIDSLKFGDDTQFPTVVAKITNESSSSDVSVFTISALEGNTVVATFNGSASEIQKGESTTVTFYGDNAEGWDPNKKYTLRFESGL
jgi:hypothetical protein